MGFFAECAGHDPCVTPGVYAIIGSAAMLSAVSRMTVSLVVSILHYMYTSYCYRNTFFFFDYDIMGSAVMLSAVAVA